VSLAPDNPSRWDAAGLAGWLAVNKSDIAPDWNDWPDAARFEVSAGYYLTGHLKLELEASTTAEGRSSVQSNFVIPGQPFPAFRFGEHSFRQTAAGISVNYQFFENTWFHPFLGIGVEGVRERARTEIREQVLCPDRVVCAPLPLPTQIVVQHAARPFVTGGFKWYVTERAFVRSDLRAGFSTDGREAVVWRTGLGVDF
jgi:opacity protein-like surface antigen